jgi:tRNA (guanosine-2'-O-)-methyltransferase
LGPEICYNALDDNCNGPIDEGCGVDGGVVQFSIAWDETRADVDLEVTDPSGELVSIGQISQGGLSKDRDCPGADDACRGVNLENVTLAPDKELALGKYRVTVRLESWAPSDEPVRVNFGARLGARTYSSKLTLVREKQERRFEFVL